MLAPERDINKQTSRVRQESASTSNSLPAWTIWEASRLARRPPTLPPLPAECSNACRYRRRCRSRRAEPVRHRRRSAAGLLTDRPSPGRSPRCPSWCNPTAARAFHRWLLRAIWSSDVRPSAVVVTDAVLARNVVVASAPSLKGAVTRRLGNLAGRSSSRSPDATAPQTADAPPVDDRRRDGSRSPTATATPNRPTAGRNHERETPSRTPRRSNPRPGHHRSTAPNIASPDRHDTPTTQRT